MARGATVLQFEIELSDVDRGVYDTLQLNVAQHPSESAPYVVARVLAFALEHDEGLAFTTGLSSSDVPAIEQRDLTGRLLAWIEVGTPAGPRLHKASKAADRVAVYCHKNPQAWLRGLDPSAVHGAEDIALFGLDPAGVEALADALQRRNRWSLSRIEGVLYLDLDGTSHELALTPLRMGSGTAD